MSIDQPKIPPKGELSTRHRLDRVRLGFDIFIEVRSIDSNEMSEDEGLAAAWVNLGNALQSLGVDLQYGIEHMMDDDL